MLKSYLKQNMLPPTPTQLYLRIRLRLKFPLLRLLLFLSYLKSTIIQNILFMEPCFFPHSIFFLFLFLSFYSLIKLQGEAIFFVMIQIKLWGLGSPLATNLFILIILLDTKVA